MRVAPHDLLEQLSPGETDAVHPPDPRLEGRVMDRDHRRCRVLRELGVEPRCVGVAELVAIENRSPLPACGPPMWTSDTCAIT
jgi:hypothetical protein